MRVTRSYFVKTGNMEQHGTIWNICEYLVADALDSADAERKKKPSAGRRACVCGACRGTSHDKLHT